MAKLTITIFFIFLLFIDLANAQNKHSVGLYSQLSTKQSGTPGIALKYQWQFNPSFAFESQYSSSGDIKIKTNSTFYQGDQSLLSVGAVFIKHYSPELAIKFSGGANYVASSSDELFIQQSSISPYLKLTLEYQLTDQFSLEVGQTSYFQSDQLSNHHNLFIGINYLFSAHYNSSTSLLSKKSTELNAKQKITETEPLIVTKTPALTSSLIQKTNTSKSAPVWVIQLGAYSDELYADEALIEFNQNPLFKLYHVEFFDNYFRIISPNFTDHAAAQKSNIFLKTNHGINNLIKQRN